MKPKGLCGFDSRVSHIPSKNHAKKSQKSLSITGIVISRFAVILAFNDENSISRQSLTGIEINSQKNLIYLFINMAITFAFGGISLKTLLDDMQG